MNIPGLGARAALLKQQKITKPCPRCGLRYPQQEPECAHCGHLDEAGLAQLRENIEKEYQGRKALGQWFLMAAIGVLLLMALLVRR